MLMGVKLMPLPDDPRVRFAGLLPDQERLHALQAATVVVVPSPYESLSLLALEAFAVGTPILANARAIDNRSSHNRYRTRGIDPRSSDRSGGCRGGCSRRGEFEQGAVDARRVVLGEIPAGFAGSADQAAVGGEPGSGHKRWRHSAGDQPLLAE